MELMNRFRVLRSIFWNRSAPAGSLQRRSAPGQPENRHRASVSRLAAVPLALGVVVAGASLWTGPSAHAAITGMVSVTFDDGWASQYNNALPVLNKYGVPATMYIYTEGINDVPLYMTQAQIQGFASRGDEIASHTVSHADLTTLTATERNTELSQSRATLQQMFGPTAGIDFASPYGAYNATTTTAVRNYYATQRNTDEGFNSQTGFDPYNILVQNVVSTTSNATVQGWINSAKANNTWLVLVYHEIGANIGSDIYHTDTAALDANLAAVKNSGLAMVTVRQGVQAMTAPAATAPGAPTGVTATAGNAAATVSWTAPASNGGSAITSYTVTPRTGTTNLTPVTITGNPPATSTTITGLTNGTAYTFTVTATNAIGTSPASTPSATVTPTAPVPTGGMVSVALDDGWASQFNNALPVLNKYGVPATMYIYTEAIGQTPTYMTQAQIQGFANRGDEIASHTVTHSDLTTLTATQRNNELSQSRATLQQMFGPTAAIDFASPYGAYNATTTAAVKNYYASQRNTDGGFNARAGFDPYNILVQNVVSTTSNATVQGWINSAKTNNTWLVLVYHEIGANIGGDIYNTPTAAFDSHLAAVKNSGLAMVTVRQGVQAFAPAPTAPAAPSGVTATAGNASATVAWTAPNNGGSAITSYTVTPRTGTTNLTPVTVTGNPPATSTSVTGLTNGTAYTFTVTATNAIGTSPASGPSNSVTPAVATPGTFTNGGFESGLTGWTTGGVRAPVASTTARTGTGSALVGLASGAEPLGDSILSQTITVPATGTPTLSFWYKPHTTDEPCSGTACRYDWSEAQLRSSTGTVLRSLFKRASNSATWTLVTADLSAYRGQSITLWFNVHLDGAVPADDTWMFVDDVTLTTG